MITIPVRLAGDECIIRVPENEEDLDAFRVWVGRPRPYVAVDTEATGLDIYGSRFRVRAVQFGSAREAWVLLAGRHASTISMALSRLPVVVVHQAAYDGPALDRSGLASLESFMPRVIDTRILAHLADPRAKKDGGTGHGLEDLGRLFVDSTVPKASAELYAEFHKIGANKHTGWALIDSMNPVYLRYAGLDVLLTARLYPVLRAEVKRKGMARLSDFEHAVQILGCRAMRRGVAIDIPYLDELSTRLRMEAERWAKFARRIGVTSVNSPTQVAAALIGMGESLTERTPTGNLKVDKNVLLPLADLDRDLERIGARIPNPLAEAVFHSKRAAKWDVSYASAMLDQFGHDGRLHPYISTLQARTARMSISRPPFQQLPSGDWTIRRAVLADPGWVVGGSDYATMEMRVLAALADVKEMKRAIAAGEDLHDYTARLVKGDNFTPKDRKVLKGAGLGKVFGGGADTLARQTGSDIGAVRNAISAYDRVYPEINWHADRLKRHVKSGHWAITTVTGRVLPVDRDRIYGALNYDVQSTARDIFAQAWLDLADAGLEEYVMLPEHDEFVWQAPADIAADVGKAIADVMTRPDFMGVRIDADADLYGASWGHGYGCQVRGGKCVAGGDHPHKLGVAH